VFKIFRYVAMRALEFFGFYRCREALTKAWPMRSLLVRRSTRLLSAFIMAFRHVTAL
jgi:hypothetical protein